MNHPTEPVILSYNAAEQRSRELRYTQDSLGGGVDGDRLEVAIDHDDSIGEAIENFPPQAADAFLDDVTARRHEGEVIIPNDVLKAFAK
jgi:hypothetical protein